VESLAEDRKLSIGGRQPSLFSLSFDFVCVFCFCRVFQEKCLSFKFGGAFFYGTLELHRSFGIIFLVTLGTMCHFSLVMG
jgi:hypothetical protein